MSARLNGLAVAEVTAGLVLALSGVKNQTIGATLKSLLSGQSPADIPETAATIGVASSGASASGTGAVGHTDSSLANAALGGVGHAYAYGGACGPDGSRPWDCSSAAGWWLHEAGLGLPGGSWAQVTGNGSSHGPSTLSYLAWTGATTIGGSAAQAQAGDLCVWQTHMGVAIGGSQMVSALNESKGTLQTPIDGVAPAGEVLVVRRVKT